MQVDVDREIHRAAFPAGVRVRAYRDVRADALVIRAEEDGPPARALEYAVTQGGLDHYGEGPMIATLLKALREHAESGLPEVRIGEDVRRVTLTGD